MVNPWENHGIFPGFSHGSHENPMINPWNQLNNTRRLEVEIGWANVFFYLGTSNCLWWSLVFVLNRKNKKGLSSSEFKDFAKGWSYHRHGFSYLDLDPPSTHKNAVVWFPHQKIVLQHILYITVNHFVGVFEGSRSLNHHIARLLNHCVMNWSPRCSMYGLISTMATYGNIYSLKPTKCGYIYHTWSIWVMNDVSSNLNHFPKQAELMAATPGKSDKIGGHRVERCGTLWGFSTSGFTMVHTFFSLVFP